MATTYDPTQPTLRDRARFYVGDTDMTKPLLADEEYEALLSQYEYNTALAEILESLANKFSAYPDEYDEQGRIRVSWKNRGQAWLANAKRLRVQDTTPAATAPQNNGIAIGTIAVNNAGYRPHQNTAPFDWETWKS
jgi:hypothetical protein